MRYSLTGSLRRVATAATLCGALLPVLSPAAAHAQTDAPWQTQSAPALAGGGNLLSIAAIAPGDVWVAGLQDYRYRGFQCDGCFSERPALSHWDGTAWKAYDVPGFPTSTQPGDNYLDDLSAISSNDVWVLGRTGAKTRLGHWNGSAWSELATDDHGNLSALAGEVWVGEGKHFSRWDGRTWQTFANPTGGYTYGLTMRAPGDGWAVGEKSTYDSATGLWDGEPYIEHWDGTAWTDSTVPRIREGRLTNVTANSATDVWAVGYVPDTQQSSGGGSVKTTQAPIALHFDGTTWKQEDITSVAPGRSTLADVTGAADGGVWAVGRGDGLGLQPLILRYQNGRWSRQSAPIQALLTTSLQGVSRIPGTNQAWTMGGNSLGPLLYHN